MRLVFATHAWEDYLYWQATDNRVLRRINALISDTVRDPFDGIGKPEALRGDLSGFWSRRITDEHRIVYRVEGGDLLIAALRFHYS
jgi:toxin YoeB